MNEMDEEEVGGLVKVMRSYQSHCRALGNILERAHNLSSEQVKIQIADDLKTLNEYNEKLKINIFPKYSLLEGADTIKLTVSPPSTSLDLARVRNLIYPSTSVCDLLKPLDNYKTNYRLDSAGGGGGDQQLHLEDGVLEMILKFGEKIKQKRTADEEMLKQMRKRKKVDVTAFPPNTTTTPPTSNSTQKHTQKDKERIDTEEEEEKDAKKKEEESEELADSENEEKVKSTQPAMVIGVTRIEKEERKLFVNNKLRELASLWNVKLEVRETYKVTELTHLIVGDSKLQESTFYHSKVLSSLVHGSWICTVEWLSECQKVGKFVHAGPNCIKLKTSPIEGLKFKFLEKSEDLPEKKQLILDHILVIIKTGKGLLVEEDSEADYMLSVNAKALTSSSPSLSSRTQFRSKVLTTQKFAQLFCKDILYQ